MNITGRFRSFDWPGALCLLTVCLLMALAVAPERFKTGIASTIIVSAGITAGIGVRKMRGDETRQWLPTVIICVAVIIGAVGFIYFRLR